MPPLRLDIPWWHRSAVCRDADSDLFFVDRGRTSKAAKAFCAKCPVRAVCLEWALTQPEKLFGIWGGITPVERRAEKRRRRSPGQRVRAGRRDETLRDPVVDVDEAVEPGALEDADVVQRSTVELHVGEVLEEGVVRLVVGALELLTGERGAVLAGERVDPLTDDHPEVLEAHLVDALVGGRDELDTQTGADH